VNPLTSARHELAAALTAAQIPTSAEEPERAAPPFRYVLRGDVGQSKQQFGDWDVPLRVVCVTKRGTSAAMSEAADDMALEVLTAVRGMGAYTIGSSAVSEPQWYEHKHNAGQPTLAVTVTVNARVSRAEMGV